RLLHIDARIVLGAQGPIPPGRHHEQMPILVGGFPATDAPPWDRSLSAAGRSAPIRGLRPPAVGKPRPGYAPPPAPRRPYFSSRWWSLSRVIPRSSAARV